MKIQNIEKEIQILLNLFNAGKFDMVISKSKKLIRNSPDYLVLYNILGSSYQNFGELDLAKNIFIKGLKLDPTNIAIKNNLANVYKNLGNIELSEELFRKIIEEKPDYINAYINLGNLKRDNNDFREAINLYNNALKINNKNPITLYSLALAHQGLGNFNQAIEFAKKTLQYDPLFTRADMLICQSTKYADDNKHYAEMNLKINNPELNNDQKVNLLFAIAKANEDMGLYEKAFKNFDEGNQIKKKITNYNINKEITFFTQLKNIFSQIDFNKKFKESAPSKNIIFILGMPRSGTSLIEQIVTSHSGVFGAGELPQLSHIVKNKLMYQDTLLEENIKNLINNPSFANILRKDYYDYLKRFQSNELFITDKAPLNFRWIGLIKILFPDSKIIHCSRNPKDNFLSLYKNLFEGGLNFSYNQKDLATYYSLYSDLMNFWETLFPGSIYEAKYEKIIENSEDEIKKIINFCGLPWEESCLQFHKNKTPIKTMSTAQARQPIYKSSVNSFEKFSPFLSELNKIS